MIDQLPLDLPPPKDWAPPKGRHGCKRDPAAGPGTCWHWWDGCPDATKRGCYLAWLRAARRT